MAANILYVSYRFSQLNFARSLGNNRFCLKFVLILLFILYGYSIIYIKDKRSFDKKLEFFFSFGQFFFLETLSF